MLKKIISKDKVLKATLILASGAAGAKLIGVLAMPVLTRIYSPADFGIMSVFVSASVIVAPILNLRYAAGIPLMKNETAALNLVVLCFILTLLSSVLLILILKVSPEYFSDVTTLSYINNYIEYFIATVICISISEILQMWSTRKQYFKIIALSQMGQNLIGIGLKLSLGILGWGSKGLIIGQIFQQGSSFVFLMKNFLKSLIGRKKNISLSRMWNVAKVQRGFPIFRAPSHFLMAFSMQSPIIFVTWLHDKEAAGYMGLAMMSLALPISILGQTASQAYYSEIALNKKDTQLVLEITKKLIRNLVFISVLPALIVFLYGPEIFSIIFGKEWVLSGEIASILCVYLVFQFISNPLMNIFNIYGKQSMFLILNIVRSLSILFVFLKFGKNVNLLSLIWVYSIWMVLYYSLCMAISISTVARDAK